MRNDASPIKTFSPGQYIGLRGCPLAHPCVERSRAFSKGKSGEKHGQGGEGVDGDGLTDNKLTTVAIPRACC